MKRTAGRGSLSLGRAWSWAAASLGGTGSGSRVPPTSPLPPGTAQRGIGVRCGADALVHEHTVQAAARCRAQLEWNLTTIDTN